jgi:hypothetical protein
MQKSPKYASRIVVHAKAPVKFREVIPVKARATPSLSNMLVFGRNINSEASKTYTLKEEPAI